MQLRQYVSELPQYEYLDSKSSMQVRIAASKALSLITLKLPVDMASQVVEEVIASLKRDVYSIKRGDENVQEM